MYDVAVIGAGPAGATCARQLALKGYKVALIDKDTFPRDKPCGGWITPNVLDFLDWNQKKFDNIFWSPICGLGVYAPSLKNFTINKEKILSYGILREQFDNMIKDDALDAGSQFLEGKKLTNLTYKADSVQLKIGNEEIEAKLVIGADGTRSKVAEISQIRNKWKPTDISLDLVSETKVKKEVIKDLYPDDLAFIFYNEGVGYNWIYPKISETRDESYINIGIGCLLANMKNSREMYFNFIKTLKKINLLPDNVSLTKHSAWAYNSFHGPKKTHGEKTLLIGDAGGFSSNIAGEGIRTGIVSGIIAAETISELEGDYSKAALKLFQKKWKKNLKREYDIGSALQALLTSGENSIDALLDKVRGDVETQELLIKLLLAEDLENTFSSLMKKV